ncbi:DUF58 domain-containing protein [Haloferax larsenii]|uniref:Uncharacterized conserved protein, DUF58 family, contains vWF domain n=1 Tax=Haloferax larsenii TaxID=302484 RepID=A0A1H7TEQ3_HALLR|nr:DUF58 domain-containing protein [Haloferax larsenii]SEL83025.1 Uncharacterized conserved protein, DUF58 family, contains vWF domain [Haloferax larsenii]
MQATRRYWEMAALAGFLATFGVAIDSSVFLLGGVAAATWLLAAQYRFYVGVRDVRSSLDVTLSPLRTQVGAEEPFSVRLTASASLSTPCSVTITLESPVGIDDADEWPTVSLTPDSDSATHVGTFRAPIAGEFSFDAPDVRIEDDAGLFAESFTQGGGFDIRVEPRASDKLFVGKSGMEISAGFGEHESGQRGPGVGAADLREYMPGDDISRIDWKATARLNKPHIREHDVETTREVGLIVDERSSMWDGPAGRRKIDFVREVALAFANSAASMSDPLGLYTVSEDDVQSVRASQAADVQYATIRSLFSAVGGTAMATRSGRGDSRLSVPERANDLRASLDGDSSAYARTLRPYFQTTRPYVEKVESSPFFTATRRVIADRSENLWLVFFTDDTHREELLESAKFASNRGVQLLVFVAPTTLFEPEQTPEQSYDAYLDFESFRKRLDRLTNVSAMELSPKDKRETLLRGSQPVRNRAGGNR